MRDVPRKTKFNKEQILFTRREVIVSTTFGLVAATLSPVLTPFQEGALAYGAQTSTNDRYLTSVTTTAGAHSITAIDSEGKVYFSLPVAHRCHATAIHPKETNRAVIFPKRPGYTAYLIDLRAGLVLKEIKARPGRYFYGHGTFSSDGKYLVATESDIQKRKGVVSVWDGKTLDFVGEIESFGVGPHELLFSNNGKTLIVANGGLFEDPSVGEGSNLGRTPDRSIEMDPSLAYINFESTKLDGLYKPGSKKLGLRHLALGNDGMVAIAIQDEGKADELLPLIAFHKGGEIRTALAPEPIQRKMNHYALSIVIEPTSNIVCMTCPKGDLATFWDGNENRFLSSLNMEDVGGVAIRDGISGPEFLISSGVGGIATVPVAASRLNSEELQAKIKIKAFAGVQFDNHLSKKWHVHG